MSEWTQLKPCPPPIRKTPEKSLPEPLPRSPVGEAWRYSETGELRSEGVDLNKGKVQDFERPSGVAWGAADVMAAGEALGEPPPVLVATSRRAWWPEELRDIEETAQKIMQGQAFPWALQLPQIRWAWSAAKRSLYWTDDGAIELPPGHEVVRLEALWNDDDFLALWPRWSGFDWAFQVWRHRERLAHARQIDSLGQAWTAGFELAAYLGEADVRRRYKGTKVGSGSEGRKVDWAIEGLALAIELRKQDPSRSQSYLATKIKATVKGCPGKPTIVKRIASWEQSGKLPRGTQNRSSAP